MIHILNTILCIGWEIAATELDRVERFSRPTIADGLSEDMRRAIEAMKQQQQQAQKKG